MRRLKDEGKAVPKYLKRYIRTLDTNLDKMRSVAVYYKEYSSIEKNYIKQMKRDLTPKTFQTSILCQRIGIAKDGFYSSMREGHKYNASNFEYLDKYAQEYFASLEAENNSPSVHRGSTAEPGGSIINTSLCDSDVNPLAPICIGMDYNANINWIVAGQPEGRRLNIIKSFYVKFERKIPALVEEFCNYYAHH